MSNTKTETSFDLWLAYKSLFNKNAPIGDTEAHISERILAFEKWEAKVVEEMVFFRKVDRENQFWGGYTSIAEFVGRND